MCMMLNQQDSQINMKATVRSRAVSAVLRRIVGAVLKRRRRNQRTSDRELMWVKRLTGVCPFEGTGVDYQYGFTHAMSGVSILLSGFTIARVMQNPAVDTEDKNRSLFDYLNDSRRTRR